MWQEWAEEHAFARYCGANLEGTAGIDWDDAAARRAFLQTVVADVERLFALDRRASREGAAEEPGLLGVRDAADALAQLLNQDVERRDDGAALWEGVSLDRVLTVQDPEMRHGRKSVVQRFDGHRGAIVAEGTESDSDASVVTDTVKGC